MPLKWLKQRGEEAQKRLKAEVSRYQNRTFLEAITAACAMIAAADGTISSEEKQKMNGYIRQADELEHFNTDEVIASFQKTAERFEFDYSIGEMEALKTISKIKGNEDQARVLIRVAIVIGAADGEFDPQERSAAEKICRELGQDPAEFDI